MKLRKHEHLQSHLKSMGIKVLRKQATIYLAVNLGTKMQSRKITTIIKRKPVKKQSTTNLKGQIEMWEQKFTLSISV